jgi:C1A family cysteine protease
MSQLKAALGQGPVAVSVQANQNAFMYYQASAEGGAPVLFADSCPGTQLDHTILAVGYGEIMNVEFLIVRNSWGAGWGAQGYIYLAANDGSSGACGVLLDPTIPFTN